MPGAHITWFQALDDHRIFILDGTHTLYYGDVNVGGWQPVQTNVGWFGASAYSPDGSYVPTIWIEDMHNNLYQWQLGWQPTGNDGNVIAYGVQAIKVSYRGHVFWKSNGALYTYGPFGYFGGMQVSQIDGGNVSDFFPPNYGGAFDDGNEVYDLGTDGNLWQWYFDTNSHSWSRWQRDANARAAQAGCFENINGQCHDLVLGTDHKLWAESGFSHGPNDVDANVYTFFGTGTGDPIYIENLWGYLFRLNVFSGLRDVAPLDGNVSRFQPIGAYLAWVQGTDGNLWREHFGAPPR
jgi:hypothetical protein